MPASLIEPATIQAYLETDYHVFGPPAFTLRVGHFSGELLAAHEIHGTSCSAFMTAFNPFSRVTEGTVNAMRQNALIKKITEFGLAYLKGIGEHPSNLWPGEESLLVFGLNLTAAKALGQDLEQNGIIWSGADAMPQLILLR